MHLFGTPQDQWQNRVEAQKRDVVTCLEKIVRVGAKTGQISARRLTWLAENANAVRAALPGLQDYFLGGIYQGKRGVFMSKYQRSCQTVFQFITDFVSKQSATRSAGSDPPFRARRDRLDAAGPAPAPSGSALLSRPLVIWLIDGTLVGARPGWKKRVYVLTEGEDPDCDAALAAVAPGSEWEEAWICRLGDIPPVWDSDCATNAEAMTELLSSIGFEPQ